MARTTSTEPVSSISGAPAASGSRRVVIYVGADPKQDGSMFYLNLLWSLMSQGQARGWEMVPLVELREQPMAVLRPPELDRIVEQGPIGGIVSFMIYSSVTDWISEAGVPWSAFIDGKGVHHVFLDYTAMVRDSLLRLAELGCRSAGLIMPSTHVSSDMLEQIDAISSEVGIKVNYEWIIATRERQEEGGYNDMCALWNLKPRPEGLVVFPDRTARGVVSAIMEKRIRVPEELKLVLHRNAESPYVVPMPCDWIEVSVSGIASAMLDDIARQWAGKIVPGSALPMRLIKGY